MLALLALLSLLGLCGGYGEANLTKNLLSDYVITARPVNNDEDIVQVSVGLRMQELYRLDYSSISGLFWLHLEWVDQSLVWNTDDWQVKKIMIPTSDIWLPDIELYNAVKKDPLLSQDLAVVYPTGQVVWVSSYRLTASCKIWTTYFPFDEQFCDLKFGSWVYSGWKLNISLANQSGMKLGSYMENTEWEVVNTTGRKNEVIYDCCPDPYQDITYTLHVRRRSRNYLRYVIVPSFCITLVSIMVLLIPATHPSPRFITLFLLTMLFCSTLPEVTPQDSVMASLLGWCYSTLLCVLINSIIVTAIANQSFLQSCSFNNTVFRSITFGLDKSKPVSEELLRYKISKSLDTAAILLILLIYLFGFLGTLLNMPFFNV